MQNVINWLLANSTIIFAALFFISEALALIPGIKANSIFQAIFNFLKSKQTPPSP